LSIAFSVCKQFLFIVYQPDEGHLHQNGADLIFSNVTGTYPGEKNNFFCFVQL